mmetsp:Transcript_2050/g.4721  ORF Transcript_2050/g.4721 Transcript_2050/m.4721 type:complete len:370 (-) Transcript_2050:911-2020(-)
MNSEGAAAASASTLEAAAMLANFPGRLHRQHHLQPPAAVSPLQYPQPQHVAPSEDQHPFPQLLSMPVSSGDTGTGTASGEDGGPMMKKPRSVSVATAPTTGVVVERGNNSKKDRRDDDGNDNDEDDDNDDNDNKKNEDGNNDDSRVARSRERNREHARRTRVRKKAHLESLQSKVKGLQAESKALRQSLEECSIASILVGLSTTDRDATIQALVKEACEIENEDIFKIVGGKRKRFSAESINTSTSHDNGSSDKSPAQPLTIQIDGAPTVIGGPGTHINWKTGMYSNQQGFQRLLTQEQLEALRRERNRMHAKMTRDRKKSFISTIEHTISRLEASNRRMKNVLKEVVQTHFDHQGSQTTPGVLSSPST